MSEENKKETVEDSSGKSSNVRKFKKRRKPICMLCKWGFLYSDYKDCEFLKKRYLKNNKIISHKITGNCLKHQHQIARSIKRARVVGLLPFVEG